MTDQKTPARKKAPQPASREDLQRLAKGFEVPGPSGLVYRIRPINLQRHALAGGFPAQLRAFAIRRVIGGDDDSGFEDDQDFLDKAAASREYFDAIVRQVIIDPDLTEPAGKPLREQIAKLHGQLEQAADHERADLEKQAAQLEAQLEPDPIDGLPPADYDWAFGIANGNVVVDGLGNPLFGKEGLQARFREALSK